MAEQGNRAWVAADLLAVAKVLQTTVGELFRPVIEEAAVELGGPSALPRDEVFDLIWVRSREDLNLAAIQETITRMADAAGRSESSGRHQRELARELDTLIVRRLAEGGVVSLPLAEPGASPAPLPYGWSSGQEGTKAVSQPVVAAIVTSAKGVLVSRRNDGEPPWGFITGEVEPGEHPEHAAEREVKEETGLEVRIGDEIGRRVHPRTGRTLIYMAARPVRGTRVFVGDESELAEVRWASLSDALTLLPDMYEPVRDYLARQLGTVKEPGR
jgi:8-oxo-dGTP pyrophosphatase MutT (NUDIX family)